MTPIIRAPRATARSTSAASLASTSTSMPSRRAVSDSRFASSSLTMPRITSTASAPAIRWRATCSGNTVKSFASAGIEIAPRAADRSSGEPPKSRSAHSTETQAAPPSS